MSSYARWLQTMASAPQKGKGMLSTDSRIRPDVVALNTENNGEAASAKHMLEEKQRAEKKVRVASARQWRVTPLLYFLRPPPPPPGALSTVSFLPPGHSLSFTFV